MTSEIRRKRPWWWYVLWVIDQPFELVGPILVTVGAS